MKKLNNVIFKWTLLPFILFSAVLQVAVAGPYAPAADEAGTTAISKDNPYITTWASGHASVNFGAAVDAEWQNPTQAYGPAEGTATDIVCLGRGGEIVLTFDHPISFGDGWDFAIFENSFSHTFLELGYVEVSSNGTNFIRFNNDSLTASAVPGYGNIDPTNVFGLAGKYKQSYGTPFDLNDLVTNSLVVTGVVNINRITHVKIVDVVGDGTNKDTDGRVIYDPYPTTGTAGFDLDALGVRYINTSAANTAPDAPTLTVVADNTSNINIPVVFSTGILSDTDGGDIHLYSRWQISNNSDFSNLISDITSAVHLEGFTTPELLLNSETTYYCRVKHADADAAYSDWSNTVTFTTTTLTSSTLIPTDWDDDGEFDPDIKTVEVTNSSGEIRKMGLAVDSSVGSISMIQSIDMNNTVSSHRPEYLPSGLIGFKLALESGYDTALVKIYLSTPITVSNRSWYKYDSVNYWRSYNHATFSADGKTVSILLKDGESSLGDVDGVVNGIIIDPGGVGLTSSDSTEEPPGNDKGGIGGNDNALCFISTANISTEVSLIQRGLFFLIGLIVLHLIYIMWFPKKNR